MAGEFKDEYNGRRNSMPRKPESRGTCAYCGKVITKRNLSKHLDKCPKRQEALQSATHSSRPAVTLWHLLVQEAYEKILARSGNEWFSVEPPS